VIFGIPIVAFIVWNWYLKKQEKLQEGNIAFFRAKEIIKTTKEIKKQRIPADTKSQVIKGMKNIQKSIANGFLQIKQLEQAKQVIQNSELHADLDKRIIEIQGNLHNAVNIMEHGLAALVQLSVICNDSTTLLNLINEMDEAAGHLNNISATRLELKNKHELGNGLK